MSTSDANVTTLQGNADATAKAVKKRAASRRAIDPRNIPSGHTTRFVGGHPIVFPGEPYPVQLPYMERVVRALDASENALLEAPTGVGKTRALLCSSMQWMQDEQKTHYERIQEALFTSASAQHPPNPPHTNEQPHPTAAANPFDPDQKEKIKKEVKEEGVKELDGHQLSVMGYMSAEVSPGSAAALRESLWRFSCASPRQTRGFTDQKGGGRTEKQENGECDCAAQEELTGSAKRIKREIPQPQHQGVIGLLVAEGTATDDAVKTEEADAPREERDADTLQEIWTDIKQNNAQTRPAAARHVVPNSSQRHLNATQGFQKVKAAQDRPSHTTFNGGGFLNEATGGRDGRTAESVKILHQILADRNSGLDGPPAVAKPPRIFYATRTHSQISQIVQELKNTYYHPNTTILGGRKHYCIHPRVKKEKDVDAACVALIKDKKAHSCQYFINTRRMRPEKQWPVEDIEELATSCKTRGLCPYYLSRSRMEKADFILSPYNYLISPSIRNSLEIDVEGAGVILDEAHNIEDVCRDAASFESDLETINAARKSFEKKRTFYEGHDSQTASFYAVLEDAMEGVMLSLQGFLPDGGMRKHKMLKQVDDFRREVIFDALQTMNMFEEAGMGSAKLIAIEEAYKNVKELEEPQLAEVDASSLSASKKEKVDVTIGLSLIAQLQMVLEMMYQGPSEFTEAFKACIRLEKPSESGGGRRRSLGFTWSLQLNIWCLNAAVAFSQVVNVCRSVILTSGTLAPLSSFASELGTEFKFVLEARHVVDMQKQVWASACGADPMRNKICCTYAAMQDESLWDQIGSALLNWCACIPDGVLVFVSSFRAMHVLMERWQRTGVYDHLSKLKTVFKEERAGGDNFDEIMQSYYQEVDKGRGALFFGVCRGKASEGINFADGYARSVVMIGIPYPALMDPKVKLKKEYNSKWAKRLGLVDGNIWYDQQAFRALNQGIGRCIRHKQDFGAILLLDSRYMQQARLMNISKWVRDNIQKHDDFRLMIGSVQRFFALNNAPKESEEATGKLVMKTEPDAEKMHPQIKTEAQIQVKKLQPDLNEEQIQQADTCKVQASSETTDHHRSGQAPPPSHVTGKLVGFDSLLKHTVAKDVETFSQCIVNAGVLNQNHKKTVEEAAKRSVMDCLFLCAESGDDLQLFLSSWLHAIPSGLIALLELHSIMFPFAVSHEMKQHKGLSAHGTLKDNLRELEALYAMHLGIDPHKRHANI